MNPHTSAHSPGTPPGPHRGVGPGGTGKFALAEASSIVLCRCSLPDCRRHAAPLKSPATMSTVLDALQYGLQVTVFFVNSTLLSILIVGMERHHGIVGFTIGWYPSERGGRDDGL